MNQTQRNWGWGVGPISFNRIDGCGSVCQNRGDREVGTVGQTVRVRGVEITGCGGVLGNGCIGIPGLRWWHHPWRKCID